ncbi:ThiF family adenylyltransferase [Legionella taurinensis]|uniref:ThiF family adenylyltransferase n=1 Tax=Legionella taurinensis TaxID=70611 RepID=A0A3A5L4W7_9GAMM|nr:ThiF family adenylyltransferase [Legionella taurinensis]MDX1838041.1 ThiF family adenylyltransferase [Legionella taurinensis]PUT39374.1 hypothetical protein DB744_09525 [Legionella taurinensis]PUT41683.1 hypothetical protein DB746_08440 [Legionella taurinensis]PUT44517.1 hypothetical protein DB743_07655 [Legionella taurinensis]PUT46761.1 hypothetical protein DB745_09520 [Legionella taurinensis]
MTTDLFIRNSGYVSEKVQQRLAEMTILIAGCGLGSYLAEGLVRFGCHHLVLVDHDTIDTHNLNRQDFMFRDVGRLKTEALAERLRLINPDATIQCVSQRVSATNAETLIKGVDLVIDTIDFLSMEDLIPFYEQCYLQKRTVISALSAGFGAVAFYIPGTLQTHNWFTKIFGIDDSEVSAPKEYAFYFERLLTTLGLYLPEEVTRNLMGVLELMKEKRPCPASQVSAGAFAAASLCVTIVHRMLSEQTLVELPYAMALDMNRIAAIPAFSLAP